VNVETALEECRVRPGVYVRPLPLRASDLPPEAWWLRSHRWCDEHLRQLHEAWTNVYAGLGAAVIAADFGSEVGGTAA
jgi:hypothetical protein